MTKRVALKIIRHPYTRPARIVLAACARVERHTRRHPSPVCPDCPIGDGWAGLLKCPRAQTCDRSERANSLVSDVDMGRYPWGPRKCLMQHAVDDHLTAEEGPPRPSSEA